MKQYVDLITTILKEGRIKTDRTGTGTISTFGHQSVFYMKDGFPLLTMKKTYPRGVFEELLWFLKGDTNIRYLNQKKVHIWDEWAYAKYKKYAESLSEPNFEIHIDDPKNNCTRIMTLEEFVNVIVDNEDFAKRWGGLGPVYGKQWVDWGGHPVKREEIWSEDDQKWISYEVRKKGINQIENIIDRLKSVPDCRRLIVSAWNVEDLGEMALTPCHTMFQFITEPLNFKERVELLEEQMGEDKRFLEGLDTNGVNGCFAKYKTPSFRLSLQLFQRSADTFLGVPFNIASYALLLHMVSQVVNMIPYKFVHSFGDAHLYLNHKEQINEFIHRTHEAKIEKVDYWKEITNGIQPGKITGTYFGPKLPTIKLNSKIKDIFEFTIDDIELIDYNPLSAIKAPIAV